MSTPTLDDTDREILTRLAAGPRDPSDLATDLEAPEVDPDLDDRLAALRDNGLVEIEAGGAYELTDSGRRVIDAPGDATADDRIDVPDRAEGAIEGFDLTPDRAAAIRGAVAFLAYWGEATGHEIADAIHAERPAGYGSLGEWWEFVRDRLAEVPGIEPPENEGDVWRYAGRPGVEDPTHDGRHGPDDTDGAEYASVKHALEALDLDADERAAVHAAFARLTEGGADVEALYDRHPAGCDSIEEWQDRIRPALEALPGVAHEDETWRYRNAVGDARSPAGGSHVSNTEGNQRADEAGAGGDDITAVRDAENGDRNGDDGE